MFSTDLMETSISQVRKKKQFPGDVLLLALKEMPGFLQLYNIVDIVHIVSGNESRLYFCLHISWIQY